MYVHGDSILTDDNNGQQRHTLNLSYYLIRTRFSKLTTENMLVRSSIDAHKRNLISGELFLVSHFLIKTIFLQSFLLNISSTRKDVLPSIRVSLGAASALLKSASLPSSRWRGLGQQSDWASFPHVARTRAPCSTQPSLCGLERSVAYRTGPAC